jgi:hypothetical protein
VLMCAGYELFPEVALHALDCIVQSVNRCAPTIEVLCIKIHCVT